MRFFNTAGPVLVEDHYAIPPLERGNVGEILKLIRDKQYFVLHAPRQTGKTSALIALRDLLNSAAHPGQSHLDLGGAAIVQNGRLDPRTERRDAGTSVIFQDVDPRKGNAKAG